MIDGYLAEWLGLLGRWFHLTLGIAWIGASFYFVWLNNAVRPPLTADVSPRVAGDLWAVHGGAFYRVQKYGGAPETLPAELHWFKWEAYLTWLSGFFLLLLVYWSNAAATMVTPDSPIGPGAAVGVAAAALAGGYVAYDLACRALARHPRVLAAAVIALVVTADVGLFQVLAPRAAYLHVGAMLGTWMAANVLFVIIPGQRAMVDAMVAGAPPPVERGAAGAQRSLHNNYFTLPVLFVMISGHTPSTWGHPHGWLVLLGIAGAGVAVRHALNTAERGRPMPWLWPIAAGSLVAAALYARPARPAPVDGAPAVPLVTVQMIVAQRCLPCHTARPILAGLASPPKGVVLDRPETIEALREAIGVQVVSTRAMPLGNLTKMTDEERATIAAWVAQPR
ncbi:MAG: urate hydroxylase PuuD [Myxococcota bacterium]